jgi:hypothetical protein
MLKATPNVAQILSIISGGACPEQSCCTSLTPMQRRQLREAIVLSAHTGALRDIFVSENTHAFVRLGRREALERLLRTRIMTAAEFFSYLAERPRRKTHRRH